MTLTADGPTRTDDIVWSVVWPSYHRGDSVPLPRSIVQCSIVHVKALSVLFTHNTAYNTRSAYKTMQGRGVSLTISVSPSM